MDNARKASDILLELESKIDKLTSKLDVQDLNIKVLSNKLNVLLEQIQKSTIATPPQKPIESYSVSADDGKMPPQLLQNRLNQVIVPNANLPMVNVPQGMRRNSRSEAPAAPAQQQPNFQQKVKIQDPSPPDMSRFKQVEEPPAEFKAFENLPPQKEISNKVAVSQRVVDKNGKSVFLADVEILDRNLNQIFKTRTNSVGKWQASLPIGNYKVIINRRDNLTKQKIEKNQDLAVDGNFSQINLDQLIMDK